jgi:hypothetical protein
MPKLLMLDSKMESFVLKKVFKFFLHELLFACQTKMDKLISETEVSRTPSFMQPPLPWQFCGKKILA